MKHTTTSRALFQFTPLREGRHDVPRQPARHRDFNSRPSARGDRFWLRKPTKAELISIHAPPRGATIGRMTRFGNFSFQFTPLREGRRPASFPLRMSGTFQFTPLREGRLLLQSSAHPLQDFNSRPSARGDDFLEVPCTRPRLISIHAPPRGATSVTSAVGIPPFVFQFTPLREGRLFHRHVMPPSAQFQFTPLREGRPSFSRYFFIARTISIHAPPRGATSPLLPY